MKKIPLVVFVCLFVFSFFSFPALSKHIVNYRIKAKLVPAEKAVIGEQILTWLNDSDVPVSELQFHLYLNAFKNNRSTLMMGRGGVSRSFKQDKINWGYNEIRNIRIQNGARYAIELEDKRKGSCSLRRRINKAVILVPPRYYYLLQGAGPLK